MRINPPDSNTAGCYRQNLDAGGRATLNDIIICRVVGKRATTQQQTILANHVMGCFQQARREANARYKAKYPERRKATTARYRGAHVAEIQAGSKRLSHGQSRKEGRLAIQCRNRQYAKGKPREIRSRRLRQPTAYRKATS